MSGKFLSGSEKDNWDCIFCEQQGFHNCEFEVDQIGPLLHPDVPAILKEFKTRQYDDDPCPRCGGNCSWYDLHECEWSVSVKVANSKIPEAKPGTIGELLESLTDLRNEHFIPEPEPEPEKRLSDELTPAAKRQENIEAAIGLGFMALFGAGVIALSIFVWPMLGVIVGVVCLLFFLLA